MPIARIAAINLECSEPERFRVLRDPAGHPFCLRR
ncbi:hypothetical protein SAMN05421748_1208 [Paractinoplanes atraurantiacus]|uniref:Glyoxalase-like domain-containing protein n=1 Tax=Paractinoplanes atraurantiacus TaxID=1036182 RepID=A0A285JFG0_9ACTN|nr:hypothetical protein SAMN05421748_1208 [Actinoplanes atraurantiacus]